MRTILQFAAVAALGFAGTAALLAPDQGTSMASNALATFGRDCQIKGNISIGSGEKIYHLPGQEYYRETVIRPEYGERWFCTEAEARQAGWRKAGR